MEQYSKFLDWTDEKVIAYARETGSMVAQEYLLSKYKNFVRSKTRSYFLAGADKEDIVQEGMIGLYKAIRDFDSERQVSFRVFADVCITRQIITAIKTATRQKHIPLNSYISLNRPVYEDESERTLLDVLSGLIDTDPETLFISREEYKDIEAKMNSVLSDLEWLVLLSYLDGKSYVDIAKELGRHPKSIDNALQRVKKKIEKHIVACKENFKDVNFPVACRGIMNMKRRNPMNN